MMRMGEKEEALSSGRDRLGKCGNATRKLETNNIALKQP